jgi:hypothetical protein
MIRAFAATALAAAALTASAAGATGGDSKVALTTGCTSFGSAWARSYTENAIQAGNPIRILAACCHSTARAGVHHCYLTVTLSGTTFQGCESVDIGRNGLPASIGRHEHCVSRVQPVA